LRTAVVAGEIAPSFREDKFDNIAIGIVPNTRDRSADDTVTEEAT
jgi:hypothetical protein